MLLGLMGNVKTKRELRVTPAERSRLVGRREKVELCGETAGDERADQPAVTSLPTQRRFDKVWS